MQPKIIIGAISSLCIAVLGVMALFLFLTSVYLMKQYFYGAVGYVKL